MFEVLSPMPVLSCLYLQTPAVTAHEIESQCDDRLRGKVIAMEQGSAVLYAMRMTPCKPIGVANVAILLRRHEHPKALQENAEVHVGLAGEFGAHRVSPRQLLAALQVRTDLAAARGNRNTGSDSVPVAYEERTLACVLWVSSPCQLGVNPLTYQVTC